MATGVNGGGKQRPRREKDKKKKPIKVRKVKEVVWDDDARKDFLTGFSKRKKARETLARNKAIDRERQEHLESRAQIRAERKEQAAANVRNAKAMYGDASSGSDGESGSEDEASDDEDATPAGPTAAYDTEDLVTTVVVEPFSLSRSPSPEPRYLREGSDSPEPVRKSAGGVESGHKAAAKKRVKNKPAARPKMTREQKLERAKGSKKVKATFLKGNKGTAGKSNK